MPKVTSLLKVGLETDHSSSSSQALPLSLICQAPGRPRRPIHTQPKQKRTHSRARGCGLWGVEPETQRSRIWKAAQALQTVLATTILGIPQGGRWEVGDGVTRRCLQVTCLRRGWLSAGDCPENSLALVLGSRPSPPGDLGSGWAGFSETTVPSPQHPFPKGVKGWVEKPRGAGMGDRTSARTSLLFFWAWGWVVPGTGLGIKLEAARAGVNYAQLFLETSQISQEREINLPVWANNTNFFSLLKVILLK